MALRARRMDRGEAGAADSSFHEVTTPWIGKRWMANADEPGDIMARLVLYSLLALVTVLLFGEALLLAALAYSAAWFVSPWTGRVRSWPFALAAVVTGLAGFFFVGFEFTAATRLWVEGTLGLLLAAWHVRRAGWPAVEAERQAKTATVPDGSESVVPVIPQGLAELESSRVPELPSADEAAVPTVPEPEDEGYDFGDDPVNPVADLSHLLPEIHYDPDDPEYDDDYDYPASTED